MSTNNSQTCITLHKEKITISLYNDNILFWFITLDYPQNEDNNGWNEVLSQFEYLFGKSENIILNCRKPYIFIMKLYENFKEHASKMIFLNAELIRYFFPPETNYEESIKKILVNTPDCQILKLDKYKYRDHVIENIVVWKTWKVWQNKC